MNTKQITVGDIPIEVVFKKIKNVHLSVNPPDGRVRISAPVWMKLDAIRVYAASKIAWIKKNQKKLQEQVRETHREYLDRESHYVWGKRYLMKVNEEDRPPSVELKHDQIVLNVRPGAGLKMKETVVTDWYRHQVSQAVEPLMRKWEPIIGVKVSSVRVRRMKTLWGSCSPKKRTIRLNTELGKKPPECLEYVLVHELVHILEPSHNVRFASLMDRFMPHWRQIRNELNRAPLGHVDWDY